MNVLVTLCLISKHQENITRGYYKICNISEHSKYINTQRAWALRLVDFVKIICFIKKGQDKNFKPKIFLFLRCIYHEWYFSHFGFVHYKTQIYLKTRKRVIIILL